ncbi:MAG: hydrogenase maturation nickel metallochaperone HypA [Gammaproteobacteria bacterium]
MHELAVCQALIEQVEDLAVEHSAGVVSTIVVRIGPLSGVEEPLLRQAYDIARAGTVAAKADLITETAPLIVHCGECDQEAEVEPSRLVCPACSNWRTTLVSGDELLLARLELEAPPQLH